jgi:hypothetical protein
VLFYHFTADAGIVFYEVIIMFSLAVGSVTNAARGREALSINGIKSKVQRYTGKKQIGCGYVLVVGSEPERCVKILNGIGIKVLDVIKK